MKKKVLAALEALRKDINDSDNHAVDGDYTTVNREDLRTLVKWAEKKAMKAEKKAMKPEELKVGDRVKLVKDIKLVRTFLRKGATGTVLRTDVYDPYDVQLEMDVATYTPLSFRISELEKI